MVVTAMDKSEQDQQPEQSKPLEQRIAESLRPEAKITSTALRELVQEVETGAADASKRAEQAREKALDPTTADTSAARREMDDAAFARDRLNAALPKLRERLKEVAEQEEYDRWVVEYERVKAECDEAAKELTTLYVPLAYFLPPLLQRIEQIDQKIRRVSEAKPRAAKAADGDGRWLDSVELTARGMSGYALNDVSILKHLKLPNWEPGGFAFAWPPQRPPDPSLFAPVVIGDPRLTTDRWWEVHEERAAAARAAEEKKQAEAEARFLAAHPGTDWQPRWEREAKERAARGRP
jgi:hypothetical protein